MEKLDVYDDRQTSTNRWQWDRERGWFELEELNPEAARSLVKTIQTIFDGAQVGGDLD